MGMFDWVNVRVDCPICGENVEDFQTKFHPNGYYALSLTSKLPSEVDEFYSSCENCGAWIEFCAVEFFTFVGHVTKKDERARTKMEGIYKASEFKRVKVLRDDSEVE